MTTRPPRWVVESIESFDEDYAAFAARGGRLHQFRESWEFYLPRCPVLMTKGISSPEDMGYRVMVYGDEQLGVEYFVGLSIDPPRRLVWLRWIDSCEM